MHDQHAQHIESSALESSGEAVFGVELEVPNSTVQSLLFGVAAFTRRKPEGSQAVEVLEEPTQVILAWDSAQESTELGLLDNILQRWLAAAHKQAGWDPLR